MQVTTGHSPIRVHLLFRISCAVGAVIAVATCLLIWSYRSMEIKDLHDHDRQSHSQLAQALAGTPAQLGEIAEARAVSDLSYILSQSLFGVHDSSAKLFCPAQSAKPTAEGGVPIDPSSFLPARGVLSAGADLFIPSGQTLFHASSWSLSLPGHGDCRLDLFTNLGEETQRIFSRSYHIALSSVFFEGLFFLALLLIARRGDKRLVESEKEQLAMESELFFLAHYDTLTHLPNRSLFWERFDAAISRAERLGKAVGLILVDLRDFSVLNDAHGRTVGDRALVETARRVQAAARSSDLVCRIGSDEFAVLLEDLDPERAMDAALRLSGSLAKQFSETWLENLPLDMRCNCGAAFHPHDGAKSEDILVCAQQAAKIAKERNAHIFFYGDALVKKKSQT